MNRLLLSWCGVLMACCTIFASTGDLYQNPILYADYSDPDAIRIGDRYLMTASSFNCSPGLQIMESSDLVHWQLVDAALPYAIPGGAPLMEDGKRYGGSAKEGSPVQHGNQVWAPSIREHKGVLYITWGDPDVGIFVVSGTPCQDSKTFSWSEPHLLMPALGYIDATPLWDEDGRTYLVHAMAGSRAGLKSVLCMAEVNEDLTTVLSPSRIVFDGHRDHPTCEGPKLYKRNGYYYIFTPAGGVSTGWQLVLRSKHIYGPYEERIVLAQGKTQVNGPHQGAWVTTPKGEDWFLHFQDVGPLGRIVHLQPMSWKNDWPVIGVDPDGDGCGQPVDVYGMPDGKPLIAKASNATNGSDSFDSSTLGLQWQWQTKPESRWYYCDAVHSRLRLYSVASTWTDGTLIETPNLWHRGNLLLQKPTAMQQKVTAEVAFCPTDKYVGERAGLVMMGQGYAAIVLQKTPEGIELLQLSNPKARKDGEETIHARMALPKGKEQRVYLQLCFETEDETEEGSSDRVVTVRFSYSTNGKKFTRLGDAFRVTPGMWIGAKYGLFCNRPPIRTNDGGWLDIYRFEIE